MSRRHCCCKRDHRDFGIGGFDRCGGGNGLLILILIALQFKCRRNHHDDDCDSGVIDNSILFLITLFFLVCHSNRFSLGCCDFF